MRDMIGSRVLGASLVVVIAAVLAFAGCGSDDDSATTTTGATGATGPTGPTAAQREARRDERREARRQRRRAALRQARREARRKARQEARREARQEAQEEAAQQQAAPEGGGGGTSANCEPGYSPCVPTYPPDVDCADVGGPVTVTGSDPHGLDADSDGQGCE